jgi:glycosyl transferase family 1
MDVIYLARHGQSNADDEGSIAYALDQLGHSVECVQENSVSTRWNRLHGDLLLFHHCRNLTALERIKVPKVVWCFDLISFPDVTLQRRCHQRISWIQQVTRLADIGFMTDGDWVVRDTSGKLVWLPQGTDGRVVGIGDTQQRTIPLLFTGGEQGGERRQSCINEIRERYGTRFVQANGVYRRNLANLIASTEIVIAPDGPITDTYCSNRVFVTSGFGGFLLHPYCKRLEEYYTDGKEIVFYRSRGELFTKIDYYLANPEMMNPIREGALARTIKEHLYYHRVKRLMEIVQERLT